MCRLKRSNLRKGTLKLNIQLFVLTKNLSKHLVLIAKCILKLSDSQRKTLGLLILLGAGGVIAGEVEVAEGGTRSGHHILELLLLLLVPEVVLPLALALVAGVVLVVVVVLVRGVELLPFGAVSDEVGGVTALKAAPRRPPLLLVEHVQSSKLSHQQGDLIIRDALVLLIRRYRQRR
jgi:hypothetical protein